MGIIPNPKKSAFFIVQNVQIAPSHFAYISRGMKRPILVLQYPDSREARTVALAATRSLKALQVFKEVVLEEARLGAMEWDADEILTIQNQAELERLEKLLDKLIPNNDDES